ncbi:MAG: hypothetical protein QUS08_08015 [Methanothrix sp.]|nr:hypothetical protein [Methanothrix sp.]
MAAGLSGAGDAACSVDCNKYSITLKGTTTEGDSTLFTYGVTVQSGTCGLSHWVLSLPACASEGQILEAGPGGWEYGTWKYGKKTIHGIKFDTGLEQPKAGSATKEYYLRLAGPYWNADQGTAILKASTGTCEMEIESPSCPVTS